MYHSSFTNLNPSSSAYPIGSPPSTLFLNAADTLWCTALCHLHFDLYVHLFHTISTFLYLFTFLLRISQKIPKTYFCLFSKTGSIYQKLVSLDKTVVNTLAFYTFRDTVIEWNVSFEQCSHSEALFQLS